jgi:hypothetical protein
MMEKRHPAYADPSSPTNKLLEYMQDPKSREKWAEPESIALAMQTVVSRGERIPIRVPLGPDSGTAIVADLEKNKELFEEVKDLGFGVANVDSKFVNEIHKLR